MPFDLYSYIDEQEEANRGGGGLITQVAVILGWFVFATGPNGERFFPFIDEETRDKARVEVQHKIDSENLRNNKGGKSQPVMAVRVTVYGGDSVLNRDEVSWTEINNYLVTFKKDYKEVFKKLSIPSWYEDYNYGDKLWAQVSFAKSIDNPTWINSEGEEKENLVPYIACVYASREEAEQVAYALSNGGMFIEAPPEPPEYQFDDWDQFYRGVVEEFMKDTPDNEKIKEYSELGEYGVTPELIEHARLQAKKLREEDDIPF